MLDANATRCGALTSRSAQASQAASRRSAATLPAGEAMMPTTAMGAEYDDADCDELSLAIELPLPMPSHPKRQIKKIRRDKAIILVEFGKAAIECLNRLFRDILQTFLLRV
jgi:hypothetical protein